MTIDNIPGLYPAYPSYRYNANAAAGINPGTAANAANPAEKTEPTSANPDDIKKPGRRSAPSECKTCASRKYQDDSNEGNVSFKAATRVSPQAAGSAVRAHEGQHVSNAYKKAAQKNGKVLNASVTIKTAICPECGRTYVAGGVTKTQIKYSNEDNPYVKNRKALDAAMFKGANIDYAA